MPRIQPIEPAAASPEVGEIYRLVERLTGAVSDLMKVLAHSPAVLRAMVPFLVTVQREGAGNMAPSRIKELAILKTSIQNECTGCTVHNKALGQAYGLTPEQIAALEGDYEAAGSLTEAEKAVVAWAEAITDNTVHQRPDLFQRLTRHFTPAEIVEITVAAAMFNMLNRLKHAFGIDVEPEPTVRKLGSTLRVDLEALRDYYRKAAEAVEQRIAALQQPSANRSG